MRTSDFDYELPPERIAQHPADPRDSSRLMVLDRSRDQIEHLRFRDLPQLLDSSDLLVLNETRVLPGRLQATRIPGGGKVELLLLARRGRATWEVMVGGTGLTPGKQVQVRGGPVCEILEELGGPKRLVRFQQPISPILEHVGAPPVPPYITEPLRAADEYQTVYAKNLGSAAAPTAGFHFTQQLLTEIESRGVRIERVTLHIGMDTFAPVTSEVAEQHTIHREWCSVSPGVVREAQEARRRGARIIAVGTTTVRALETAASSAGTLAPFKGQTDLFILPGYEFKVVDVILTNFHLPRSSLLMLVSAFAGRERVLKAYKAAIDESYRFYSFGDAMLIL